MFPRRFASPNFSYCSQLHHNAAARKSTLCKLLIYKDLVGARGFEPRASCAQGRRSTESNRPVFNIPTETTQLNRDPSMWLVVRKCAHLSVGWAQKWAQR